MPSDSGSRTLVLSVVAIDLVGYSQKSVAEQMALKDSFNTALLEAIREIATDERIILDTGDGVAVGFLGDPEDALYVAMFMHDAINRDSAGSPSGSMGAGAIRTGINLGPVKLATGVGGHPNIIGDGINVAERIMQFAEPGQLTASRPVFEVMSRMSDHYATLFQFAGARTDRQVRVHDVYLVGRSAAAFRQAQQGVGQRAHHRAAVSAQPATAMKSRHAAAAPPVATTNQPAHGSPQIAIADHAPSPIGAALADFLEDRNKVAIAAVSLAVVAVTLMALLAYRKLALRPLPAETAVIATAPAPAPATAAAPLPVPAPNPPAAAASPATSGGETAATKTPSAAAGPATGTAALASAENRTGKAPSSFPSPPSLSPPVLSPSSPSQSPPAPSTAMKAPERAPTRTEPPATAAREKARDPAAERVAIRDNPRKAGAATGVAGSEQKLPALTAPAVAAAAAIAEVPRQEPVTPLPAPRPAATAAQDLVVVSRATPNFPLEAYRQGFLSGTARARATIDANGNVVGEVVILEVRPHPSFGREAQRSLRAWKFNPGAPGRTFEAEITFKY